MGTILWTPSDYAPTYLIQVDNDLNFQQLLAVFNIPPDYLEAKKLAITENYRQYAEVSWNEGWLRNAMRKNRGLS